MSLFKKKESGVKKAPVPGRKKRARRIRLIVTLVILLVIGVVAFIFIRRYMTMKNMQEQMSKMNKASQATTERGTIENTIVGTGTLAVDTAQDIKVPAGLTIEEVKVEAGDVVK